MYYVYYLQSEKFPEKYYVGLTTDVERRLKEHNSGKSIHSNKYKPWILINYTAFLHEATAKAFEEYLKTSSGRAFAKKRFYYSYISDKL